MGYTHGTIHYKYNLKIDLSSFIESILEQIDGVDDYEFDGDTLEIYGTTSNSAKSYYASATMYDPPEYDLEFTEGTIEELNVEQIVIDACNKFRDFLINGDKSISECELDEKNFNFEPDEDYGPDPDMAYEEWRDRQEDY